MKNKSSLYIDKSNRCNPEYIVRRKDDDKCVAKVLETYDGNGVAISENARTARLMEQAPRMFLLIDCIVNNDEVDIRDFEELVKYIIDEPNKLWKSEDILGNDNECFLSEAWGSGQISYQLTLQELQWLDFVRTKYSIADYIEANSDKDEHGNLIVVMNQETLTEALDEDCGGAGRATMLRDDTALQIIMMAGYITAEDRGDG